MARQSDGLYKRCSCAARKWTKCDHPWHFDFYFSKRQGKKRRRFSLNKLANKPPGYAMPKTEAEALRDDYRSQIRKGTFVDPNEPTPEPSPDVRLTVADVIDRYVKAHVNAPDRRESARETMTWHLGLLKRIEVPAARGQMIRLAELPIDAVTKAHLEAIREARRTTARETVAAREQWKADAAECATHGKTIDRPMPRLAPGVKGGEVGINRLLARVRHLFSWAIEEGIVKETPFKRGDKSVVRLTHETARIRRLGPGEEKNLLSHAGAHLRALIVAALETGCRLGELLSLQWHQIEYGPPDASGERRAQWLLLPAMKTKTAENRRVPISSRLAAVLAMREHAPDGRKHKQTAFVFGNEAGEQIGSIKTAWTATVLRAHGCTPLYVRRGGPLTQECRERLRSIDLHFHDLRREFASRLRESGAPDHEVAAWIGHANISTTSRYLKATPTTLARALRQFEQHRQIVTNIATQPDLTDVATSDDDRSKSLNN